MIKEYHINKGLKNGECYIIETFATRGKAEKYIKDQEGKSDKYIYTIIEEEYNPERIIGILKKIKAVFCFFSLKFSFIIFLVTYIVIKSIQAYIEYTKFKNN